MRCKVSIYLKVRFGSTFRWNICLKKLNMKILLLFYPCVIHILGQRVWPILIELKFNHIQYKGRVFLFNVLDLQRVGSTKFHLCDTWLGAFVWYTDTDLGAVVVCGNRECKKLGTAFNFLCSEFGEKKNETVWLYFIFTSLGR